MISIVIPTYNRNDLLRNCLTCLTPDKQGLTLDDYEVVVSDDSIEGAAQELIHADFPWVRWVKGPGRGPASNRNNAVKHTKGKWILFTDDDCLPSKGWVSVFKNAIDKYRNYRVFEGRTEADRPQRRFDEESPINQTGGKLWSCNFCVRKDLFEELSGFDEGFPYAAMEDVDFHWRISQNNHIKFLPEATVIHPWRHVRPFARLKMQYRSRVHFYRKHKNKLGVAYRFHMLKSFLVTVVIGGARLARFSFRGWKEYVAQCAMRFGLIWAF